MATASVGDILSGCLSVGSKVTIKGWIRTRRDSKAGFLRAQHLDN